MWCSTLSYCIYYCSRLEWSLCSSLICWAVCIFSRKYEWHLKQQLVSGYRTFCTLGYFLHTRIGQYKKYWSGPINHIWGWCLTLKLINWVDNMAAIFFVCLETFLCKIYLSIHVFHDNIGYKKFSLWSIIILFLIVGGEVFSRTPRFRSVFMVCSQTVMYLPHKIM